MLMLPDGPLRPVILGTCALLLVLSIAALRDRRRRHWRRCAALHFPATRTFEVQEVTHDYFCGGGAEATVFPAGVPESEASEVIEAGSGHANG